MAVLSRIALAAKIQHVITSNNNKEITGAIMNDLLQDIKDSLFNITTDTTVTIINDSDVPGVNLRLALNSLLNQIGGLQDQITNLQSQITDLQNNSLQNS